MNHRLKSVKREIDLFLDHAKSSSETVYYILLLLYLSVFYNDRINWAYPIDSVSRKYGDFVQPVITVGIAFLLIYIVLSWRKPEQAEIRGRVSVMVMLIAVITGFTALCLRYQGRWEVITGITLCILANGKNYRKILELFLYVILITMILAFVGMLAGTTLDYAKPERVYGGHSFGLTYPNTWGSLALLAAILIWYLYLKRKRVLTFTMFWSLSVFMGTIVTCQTIAVLGFLFPVFTVLVESHQGDVFDSDKSKYGRSRRFAWIIAVILPSLAFALSIILCLNMDWFHDNLYYTKLHTLAMRFVEGGYALKINSITWTGHRLKDYVSGMVPANYGIRQIVDNAYVAYLITRGVLWMVWCLTWTAIANWKCIKNSDYRLLLISIYFAFFAVMERYGLDVWMNFVLLYPLAKVSSKPMTERSLELKQ